MIFVHIKPIALLSPLQTYLPIPAPNSEGEQEPVTLILAAISHSILLEDWASTYLSFSNLCYGRNQGISNFCAVIKQKKRKGKISIFKSLVTRLI